MSNTAPFTVSEKFAGATYAKSIVLEDEEEIVADDKPDKEEDKAEDVAENVAEEVAEVVAESAIEDEEIAKSSPDETVSDVSLEDTSTTAEGESPEQLQTNPAVKTVTAKTPEECLYIGTSIEQNHNPV